MKKSGWCVTVSKLYVNFLLGIWCSGSHVRQSLHSFQWDSPLPLFSRGSGFMLWVLWVWLQWRIPWCSLELLGEKRNRQWRIIWFTSGNKIVYLFLNVIEQLVYFFYLNIFWYTHYVYFAVLDTVFIICMLFVNSPLIYAVTQSVLLHSLNVANRHVSRHALKLY